MVIRKNSYSIPGAHDGPQSMHILDEDQTDAEYWLLWTSAYRRCLGYGCVYSYLRKKSNTERTGAKKIPLTKQANQMLGRGNSQVIPSKKDGREVVARYKF